MQVWSLQEKAICVFELSDKCPKRLLIKKEVKLVLGEEKAHMNLKPNNWFTENRFPLCDGQQK